MFGCESTDQCKKLDCNTACKRDPKNKKFMGKCRPYPEDDSRTDNNDVNDYNDNNSGYNYYDADMDDYMNELMKPGKMTKNQMYNLIERIMVATHPNTVVVPTGLRLKRMRAETTVSISFHTIIPFYSEVGLKHLVRVLLVYVLVYGVVLINNSIITI